ncbi:MAG: dephospho-CoA kinase [Rhodospirillales bacterium]|nr:dephospho-CoA kinase [Alphaproteobacteria bacterium]MBL6928763.1 dephospho-CoA kinase [Rhodospirillales bacterium]
MIILGLTGSIGMGKTMAAGMFRRQGVPVHDADACVHKALSNDPNVIRKVDKLFPGVVENGRIDRNTLGARVFGDNQALAALEAILHPVVRSDQIAFIGRASVRRERLVVLDIPLLFETGADLDCDFAAVVTAPPCVQRHRVLRRPGMTPEKLRNILSRQLPDAEKTRRADFIIRSGLGRRMALRDVRQIVTLLRPQRN